MASDNETVEDIVRELRDDASKVADEQHDEDCWTNLEAMQIYYSLASRIESAWRRERKQLIDENQLYKQELTHERTKTNLAKSEVAELRECLKDAIDMGCCKFVKRNAGLVKCEDCGAWSRHCLSAKWRKALEGANAQVAEGGVVMGFVKRNGGTCGTCKRDRRLCKECKQNHYRKVKRETRLTWKRKRKEAANADD